MNTTGQMQQAQLVPHVVAEEIGNISDRLDLLVQRGVARTPICSN
ncbi:hypothetical protein [Ruegeria arenilitoris]|nr:hypothetical protein [Ruegeria arenilitoris]